MVGLLAHAQPGRQPCRGEVAGVHARDDAVQPETVAGVEGDIQDRCTGLGGVPLSGDVRVEDVADLACGVLGRVEEQHDVTHQSPAGGQLRPQGQRLTFGGDLAAAQLAGQPCGQARLIHRLKRQVAAYIGATTVGQQLRGVLDGERPQPQSRGRERIGRPQFHGVILPQRWI